MLLVIKKTQNRLFPRIELGILECLQRLLNTINVSKYLIVTYHCWLDNLRGVALHHKKCTRV